jgi:hypothetical protein
MAEDGVILGPEAIRQITEVVRIVMSQTDASWQLGASDPGTIRQGRFIGKTDAGISKGSSGTVSVYKGAPKVPNSFTLTDTGKNMTAYSRYGTVAAGRWVSVQRYVHGWEIEAIECT